MTPSNIISGFTSTGICPLNVDIFADAEFVFIQLTQRPISSTERLQTTVPQTVQNTTPFLTAHEALALVTADADPSLDVETLATSSGYGCRTP